MVSPPKMESAVRALGSLALLAAAIPTTSFGQEQAYKVVYASSGTVMAIATHTIQNRPDGTISFELVGWQKNDVRPIEGVAVVPIIEAASAEADCRRGTLRTTAFWKYDQGFLPIDRSTVPEEPEEARQNPFYSAVCEGPTGALGLDDYTHSSLADFAGAAPFYVSVAAQEPPSTFLASYTSDLSADVCHQRSEDAAIALGADRGGLTNGGWIAQFGPVTVAVRCSSGSVAISASKSAVSLGNLEGFVVRMAEGMGLKD